MLSPHTIRSLLLYSGSLYLLLLAACSCPPDETAGEWYLDNSLFQRMPYHGDEQLLFVNGQGDSSRFNSYMGLTEDSVQLNVAQLCAKDLFDVQHLFYFSNQYRIEFQAEDDETQKFTLSWRLLPIDTAGNPETQAQVVGYMTLDAWVMDYGLKLIYDDFGHELPPEAEYYQHGAYVADTVIGGQRFQDIYMAEDQSEKQTAIFYQHDQGLIGFRDEQGSTWMLERNQGSPLELGETIERADDPAPLENDWIVSRAQPTQGASGR